MRQIADSWVAVPIGSMAGKVQGLISLNDTAAEIWKILEEDHTEEEVVELLARSYDEKPETLVRSVREFTEELARQDILEK
ncbi:PqqD family protein [Ruminococcus sp. CLA-AA-H200]|uniref:PqqD family protein n=1 Tax=Ruminococcus turbiniformis TaxID=2881258 RepID=A0ABS8FZB8_9FIRM|nr:PqqD family protein [Ruminococcus turbiniformis]MCC2255317.1 PqqD family protein [Ruminococcus turbiniformis]